MFVVSGFVFGGRVEVGLFSSLKGDCPQVACEFLVRVVGFIPLCWVFSGVTFSVFWLYVLATC